MKKYLGISLLELLLVITIGASIISLAVVYFREVSLSTDVTHAMNHIKQTTQASYRWLEMQSQENFSSNPNGQAISLDALITTGLLENIKADTTNPWGGKIIVQPGSDSNLVQITLTDIPQAACINLEHRLYEINKLHLLNTCKNQSLNSYTGEF